MNHYGAIPTLNEMVGLPAWAPEAELACVSEQRFCLALDLASAGDPVARRDLLRLRVAWLNWAYGHGEVPTRAVSVRDADPGADGS